VVAVELGIRVKVKMGARNFEGLMMGQLVPHWHKW
jgi:hypothetical protein